VPIQTVMKQFGRRKWKGGICFGGVVPLNVCPPQGGSKTPNEPHRSSKKARPWKVTIDGKTITVDEVGHYLFQAAQRLGIDIPAPVSSARSGFESRGGLPAPAMVDVGEPDVSRGVRRGHVEP